MASFAWDQAKMTQPKQPPQTNSGQFSNNMYQNPQMGQYGGTQPQQGWYNPNSMQQQWGMSFQPPEAQWSGATPGRMGQDYSYNPMTGEGGWVNTAGGLQIGGSNPYGSGAVKWTDPKTGMTAINPKALMRAFGLDFGGGDGNMPEYNPYQVTDFIGGQINAPGAYGGGDWSRPEGLSAEEVINSYRPTMEAEISEGFAEAGNRLGQSGFAMSTPYAKALGDVERLARAQMNQRALEYGYDATKFDRTQELQRQMAENAERFGGWQQQGAWDMAAQQGNVGNAMQQWMLENQFGFQDQQAQNLFNQQNYMNERQSEQQMLASLLGGLL